VASIRQVRERIKSVKNIQQITRAMKMVASARLRKAQTQLMEARPYAAKLNDVIRDVAAHSHGEEHPLLRKNDTPKMGLLVMTSDKGLCAGFNAQPLQRVGARLEDETVRHNTEMIGLGRKGLDFFRRTGIKPFREWAGFWQELSWYHADLIGQELIDAYSSGRWSKVTLVYNHFKSVMAQEVVEYELLPIPKMTTLASEEMSFREFSFEPTAEKIFAYLLPRYVKISLWRMLLESKAAELAARMQAMNNATESAVDMISELTLQMNRARQALITREISELVGSAEAINA
jgi:F-type H+-transporting ATPase subunit gamma